MLSRALSGTGPHLVGPERLAWAAEASGALEHLVRGPHCLLPNPSSSGMGPRLLVGPLVLGEVPWMSPIKGRKPLCEQRSVSQWEVTSWSHQWQGQRWHSGLGPSGAWPLGMLREEQGGAPSNTCHASQAQAPFALPAGPTGVPPTPSRQARPSHCCPLRPSPPTAAQQPQAGAQCGGAAAAGRGPPSCPSQCQAPDEALWAPGAVTTALGGAEVPARPRC